MFFPSISIQCDVFTEVKNGGIFLWIKYAAHIILCIKSLAKYFAWSIVFAHPARKICIFLLTRKFVSLLPGKITCFQFISWFYELGFFSNNFENIPIPLISDFRQFWSDCFECTPTFTINISRYGRCKSFLYFLFITLLHR